MKINILTYLTYLKYYTALSVSIYFTIYMIRTFCIWEFTHPFQWIIDIPEMNPESRFMLLFFYTLYIFIKSAITSGIIKGIKN